MRKATVLVVVALALTPMWAASNSTSPSTAAMTPAGAGDLLSAGRVDDALRLLDVHLKSDPRDARAYNLLSRSYFAVQRWDDAIAAGERAVALDSNNSDYHMWLARAYGEKASHLPRSQFVAAAQLGKRVRQEFERAVQLDASNMAARSDLAEFYIEAPSFLGGGKNKAQQQADLLSERDRARALWLRGRMAEKEKRYDSAEQLYTQAITAGGDKGLYWLNLASFYARQNRPDDVERAINRAIEANTRRPSVLYDAAQVLFGAGRNFVAAAQCIRNYLRGPVEEAPAFQAHYLLGEILEKQGDNAAAAEEYKAALALAKDFDLARAALDRLNRH
ncbi:MAG: tetratricopeptide repeat protein [Terriglobales bacterium]